MAPHFPVSSKVVLTALRGLALGTTSCALAVLVEDRRRRIKLAMQIVENAQKIKAHRFYRPGLADLVLAMEEEAMLDSGMDSSSSASQPSPASATKRQRGDEKRENQARESCGPSLDEHAQHDGVASSTNCSAERPIDHGDDALVKLSVHTPPTDVGPDSLEKPFSPCTPTDSALSMATRHLLPHHGPKLPSYAFPTAEEFEKSVWQACETQDKNQLEGAVRTLCQAYNMGVPKPNADDPWLAASALLCRTCQKVGRIDDAKTIFVRLLGLGPIQESNYFSHDPVQLIRSLLARTKTTCTLSTKVEKRSAKDEFDTAVRFYLARFTENPGLENLEYQDVGLDLMKWAFFIGMKHHTESIYWRVYNARRELNEYELTASFIEELGGKLCDPKLAIRLFRLNYSKLSPPASSLWYVGSIIVKCVKNSQGFHAQNVLRLLLRLGEEAGVFRSTWAITLLHAHWDRDRDIEKVDELFRALIEAPIWKIIPHRDGVYRIMIEISLDSGNQDRAESYFDELCADNPRFRKDIRVNGLFARFKAKSEDWDEVRAYFLQMFVDGSKESRKLLCQVFVPILKEYAKNRDLAEVETFVRYYIEEIKVPPAQYMVSFLGKQYGQVEDVDSFIKWLRYCAAAGFEIGHSFGNAILTACVKHWRFPYDGVKRVYWALKGMCPDFVDRSGALAVTKRVLLAHKIRNNISKAGGRLNGLNVMANKFVLVREHVDQREAIVGMMGAIRCGQPKRAIRIYQTRSRSLHFSPWLFRVAVEAALAMDRAMGVEIIQNARDKGHDVTLGLDLLMARDLADITPGTDASVVSEIVRAILHRFQAEGLPIDHNALNKAGRRCLRCHCPSEAISYAALAASDLGEKMGYNLYNFVTAIEAYTAMNNVDGVRDVVQTALSSSYRTELVCFKSLKRARTRARKRSRCNDEARRVQALLTEAIDIILEARKEFRKDQAKLSAESLAVMKLLAPPEGTEGNDVSESDVLLEGSVVDGQGVDVDAPSRDLGSRVLGSGIRVRRIGIGRSGSRRSDVPHDGDGRDNNLGTGGYEGPHEEVVAVPSAGM